MRWIAAAACALALAAATGCRATVKTRTVAVRTDSLVNGRAPVAVDLVVVYDRGLAETAAALTARQWFTQRNQIARDHPYGVRVVSWELVPGQRVPAHRFPLRRKGARAAFLFADYLAPGDHRLRVDPFRTASVVLGPETLSVAVPR